MLGTITGKQNELIMLSKTQAKIKSILNELKEQQESNSAKHWYVVTITYSTETFYRRVRSVSEFYQKISNSYYMFWSFKQHNCFRHHNEQYGLHNNAHAAPQVNTDKFKGFLYADI